jgi:hypothetical protein
MSKLKNIARQCAHKGCQIPAVLLSDPPTCPAHLPDLKSWINRVETEKDRIIAILAREQYLVLCEEHGAVSGVFYHKVSGEPPPNISARVDNVLAFCALAAASGVIGNFSYAVLRSLVTKLIGKPEGKRFDERITAEFYEKVRTQIHGRDKSLAGGPFDSLETELELKYRLIVERRER